MGDTISTLVFRPPKPTPIDPNDYFYLDVDTTTPLYFPKHGRDDAGRARPACAAYGSGCGGAALGDMMCGGDDSDLISLDRGFLDCSDGLCVSERMPDVGCAPTPGGTGGGVGGSNTSSGSGGGRLKYRVPAFFVRRRGAKHTVLFSHGNAEDLGMMYKRMKDLALVLCVNVMAYDYTGYGLSTVQEGDDDGERDWDDFVEAGGGSKSAKECKALNVPSENMIYRNIEAAYAYLTQTRNIPSRNIILYGRSLGSGPSCYLAAKTALMGESVGGLILHSPFLSVYKVVADVWGVDVKGDIFNNEKRAANVRCPTLIIHGKKDEVVPFWHAPRLLDAIPPEFRAHPFYINDLGHNHIESRERDRYIQVITDFLMKYVPPVEEDDGNNTGALDKWLHFSNARKRNTTYTQDAEQQYRGHHNVIPEDERASGDEAKQNDSTFYINQTWMRHAKAICAEVFSDNLICNSGCSVTDWTRDSGSRGGSCGSSGSRKNASSKQQRKDDKYACYDDARDDQDEFSPWRSGNERQQEDKIWMSRQSSTTGPQGDKARSPKSRRTHSDAQNRDPEMIKISSPTKKPSKYPNKSSSMPVSTDSSGGNGLKIILGSAKMKRNGGRGGFLGFRK